MTSKTIALSGAEIRADYSGGTNAWLRNDGAGTIYASTTPGVTAGADGVVSIPAGQAAAIYGACGTVYLLGTGSVQLVGGDYTACPFKTSAQSGGSGADEVARAAIEAHEANTDIHVTAAEKAGWDGLSNPNLLINPDYAINQYGTTTITAANTRVFFADRWHAVGLEVTVNAGGGITVKGNGSNRAFIQEVVEGTAGLFGKTVTVSADIDGARYSAALVVPIVSNGVASKEAVPGVSLAVANYTSANTTAAVLIGDSDIEHNINNIKLEFGSIATPFTPPDPATELAKCQRYFIKLAQWSAYRAIHSNANYMEFSVPIPTSMRAIPTIVNGENFAVYEFPHPVAAEEDFTYSVSAISANELRLRASKEAHGLSDASLHVIAVGGVFLSAEL